jgi:hypothetical protein
MGLLQMLLIEESRAVAVVSGDASRRDAMSALFFSLRRVRDVEVLSPSSVPLRPESLSTTSACGENGGNQYIIYIQIPSPRRRKF